MTMSLQIKRAHDDDAESKNMSGNKRHRMHDASTSLCEKVGANELASAFALASLASICLSPSMVASNDDTFAESRDADPTNKDGNLVSPTEDVRSPVRSTPSKIVTFSTDTKETSRTSRRLSLPPRIRHRDVMKPSGIQSQSTFLSAHHIPHIQQRHVPHNWMHSSHPQMILHHGGYMPLPGLQTPPTPPSNKWICDFCNVASFDSYDEACNHEQSCRVHSLQQRRKSGWIVTQPRMFSPVPHAITYAPSVNTSGVFHSESRSWCEGTVSLAIPGSDTDWLSGLNCFIRERCVEAFSATNDDISNASKRGRISLHQIGIRCCFCNHRSKEETQMAAASFPLSIAGIYESVKRWQKIHMNICQDIPNEVKLKIQELSLNNAWTPTTRQYWADSAKSLGMVDTQDGIRFAADPNSKKSISDKVQSLSSNENPTKIKQADEAFEQSMTDSGLYEGDFIVYPDDMALVPSYVYFLIRQVEYTFFTDADRFVARSKGPLGYPGFQCRHCHGHAGLGKYFPVSCKSLSTNSTSQNIHSHILKCRKVSPYIKEQLIVLKEEKSQAPRLEPGWRRVFFEKIWARLHNNASRAQLSEAV